MCKVHVDKNEHTVSQERYGKTSKKAASHILLFKFQNSGALKATVEVFTLPQSCLCSPCLCFLLSRAKMTQRRLPGLLTTKCHMYPSVITVTWKGTYKKLCDAETGLNLYNMKNVTVICHK